MRKMYKRKRRSCCLCKPRKRAIAKRWSLRDEALLREFDSERTTGSAVSIDQYGLHASSRMVRR